MNITRNLTLDRTYMIALGFYFVAEQNKRKRFSWSVLRVVLTFPLAILDLPKNVQQFT